mmetsp:Transcript_21784/g.50261  ORF Transcript_21784/g.50261 Transcript_21784/m.50261 type:complete len:249 (+) Transcript_21784:626-1372(+)
MMLHGLDIDLVSAINAVSSLPSKVGLIEIKRSFVSSGVSFDTNGRTKIVECSVGYFAKVSSGVEITRSVVHPMVHIRESQQDNHHSPSQSNLSWTYYPLLEIRYLVVFVLVVLTLIPSFEMIQTAVLESSLPVAVVGIMGSIVVQCLIWTCFLRLHQFLACCLQSIMALHLCVSHAPDERVCGSGVVVCLSIGVLPLWECYCVFWVLTWRDVCCIFVWLCTTFTIYRLPTKRSWMNRLYVVIIMCMRY